ncbi:VanZ family protein [Streptomyces sp. ISL-66]|uniref:VanZ family protein n=1 Tax=Streptomyces sp. ISL-66 TaxID=2819186 RepID=UPI001BEA8D1A|nr:VanZ family protein [Streptomyces sp. ISL-66]MBT2468157.1 VanZ family protein [Streptomyces sp. ISL-66]
MNAALFVPLAFFACWATRRPLPVLAASFVLSGTIELVQALTPGMGRACDSADLAANGVGAAAGPRRPGCGCGPRQGAARRPPSPPPPASPPRRAPTAPAAGRSV